MQTKTHLFLIFLLSLIGTRIFIFFCQKPSPTIMGIRLHHYMYGIVLMIAAYYLRNFFSYAGALYAFGLALLVDQIPYLIVEREPFGDERFNGDIYWDPVHLVLLVITVILVFIFKDHLIPFKHNS